MRVQRQIGTVIAVTVGALWAVMLAVDVTLLAVHETRLVPLHGTVLALLVAGTAVGAVVKAVAWMDERNHRRADALLVALTGSGTDPVSPDVVSISQRLAARVGR